MDTDRNASFAERFLAATASSPWSFFAPWPFHLGVWHRTGRPS